MKDWHKLKPELFKKNPYYLTGCDSAAMSEDPLMSNDLSICKAVGQQALIVIEKVSKK
jgi:hypothetical protein